MSDSAKILIERVTSSRGRLAVLGSGCCSCTLRGRVRVSFKGITAAIFSRCHAEMRGRFSGVSGRGLLGLRTVRSGVGSRGPRLCSRTLAAYEELFRKATGRLFRGCFPRCKRGGCGAGSKGRVSIDKRRCGGGLSTIVRGLRSGDPSGDVIKDGIVCLLS